MCTMERERSRGPGSFEPIDGPVDERLAEYHSAGAAPCDRCDTMTVEIAYGMPGQEMFEAAERGDVVLGGCILGMAGPFTHACPRCSASEEHYL